VTHGDIAGIPALREVAGHIDVPLLAAGRGSYRPQAWRDGGRERPCSTVKQQSRGAARLAVEERRPHVGTVSDASGTGDVITAAVRAPSALEKETEGSSS
jgi:hypothetical protein